jgi:glycine C-acetyltransferase/8-amino-7-oxononanoate synthase
LTVSLAYCQNGYMSEADPAAGVATRALEQQRLRTEASAYAGSVADFIRPRGTDLLGRTNKYYEWASARRAAGNYPFFRSLDSAPLKIARVRDQSGREYEGLNVGSQDYLGLAAHPAVRDAAIAALREYGPHSAGAGAMGGITRVSEDLESAIGDFLNREHIQLFPTGWAAGYGTIAALVRPYDYIVMDNLAHNCLQQGARAATPNIITHAHIDVDAAREAIEDIRRRDAQAAILVVTEGLFSMDSDSPRISLLVDACRNFGATLLVDVAHDLGELGPGGTGILGMQGVLDDVDLIMGAFSKTFASNGGFLASRSEAVKDYVRTFGAPGVFSNALSAPQAAAALEALRIVRSQEGDLLRERLLQASVSVRGALADLGFECLGMPSALVPVPVGADAVGRLAARLLAERGIVMNLVEFPAVAIGGSRFRLQLQSVLTAADCQRAAALIASAISDARRAFDELGGDGS